MKKLQIILSLLSLILIFSGNSYAENIKVYRISGGSRYDTSVKISRYSYKKSDNVILASGENFADALSGTQLALSLNAPILLTPKNNISNEIINEIERLGAKKVYILGGESSISNNVYKNVSRKYTVTRIGGRNRYKTSELIMNKVKREKGYKDVVLVSGENFADALSASSYIYSNNSLLLLTDGKHIPKTDGKIVAIGGKKSIELKGFTGKRISGRSRYDTSFEVAKEFNTNTLIMASGENYPDALSAISLVKTKQAPILLVSRDNIGNEEFNYIKSKISNVFIVGGEKSISKRIENILLGKENINDFRVISID